MLRRNIARPLYMKSRDLRKAQSWQLSYASPAWLASEGVFGDLADEKITEDIDAFGFAQLFGIDIVGIECRTADFGQDTDDIRMAVHDIVGQPRNAETTLHGEEKAVDVVDLENRLLYPPDLGEFPRQPVYVGEIGRGLVAIGDQAAVQQILDPRRSAVLLQIVRGRINMMV